MYFLSVLILIYSNTTARQLLDCKHYVHVADTTYTHTGFPFAQLWVPIIVLGTCFLCFFDQGTRVSNSLNRCCWG